MAKFHFYFHSKDQTNELFKQKTELMWSFICSSNWHRGIQKGYFSIYAWCLFVTESLRVVLQNGISSGIFLSQGNILFMPLRETIWGSVSLRNFVLESGAYPWNWNKTSLLLEMTSFEGFYIHSVDSQLGFVFQNFLRVFGLEMYIFQSVFYLRRFVVVFRAN